MPNTSKTPRDLRTIYYMFFVAVTGASVMMLEFAVSRLIAPWFGTSQFVWGNVIGVILIALSAGYYIGGKYADSHPTANVLLRIVLGAGVFSSIIPLLAYWLTQKVNILALLYTSSAEVVSVFSIVVGSFFAILLLAAVPIFLLGMVSPYVIRLATDSVASAGSVAGKLYAASTVGSIVGTFAGSFFLIPYLGSRETVLLSAVSLIALATIGRMVEKQQWVTFALWLCLPIAVYLVFSGQLLRSGKDVVFETETPYQFVQVLDEGDRLALVYNEGLGTQSYFMKEGVLTGAYFDYIGLLPQLVNNSTDPNILVMGMAGGTITRQYHKYYPQAHVTGVEIDPEIISLAKKYFKLDEQTNVTPQIADARPFLQKHIHSEFKGEADLYDVVVVDAYTNEFHIPWHLTTQEFFEELAQVTTDSGVVAMNIGVSNAKSPLLQSILKTANSVFSHAYVLAVPHSSNYMLTLSQRELPLEELANITDERAELASYAMQQTKPAKAASNAIQLTDNRAPVEIMTELMIINAFF